MSIIRYLRCIHRVGEKGLHVACGGTDLPKVKEKDAQWKQSSIIVVIKQSERSI